MTVPLFIEEPLTWKKIEVPYEIVQYCDMTTFYADREDLRYIDCVWMHMGYYGVPKHVMKAHRDEFYSDTKTKVPQIAPLFE